MTSAHVEALAPAMREKVVGGRGARHSSFGIIYRRKCTVRL